MERTKLVICDKCNKVVAESKCDICGKDLCSDCRKRDTLTFSERIFCKLYFCSNCVKIISKLTKDFTTFEEFKEFFDKDESIRNGIISRIKKELILKSLYQDEN